MGLASILVRLGLDSTGYNTGLKRAESMTTSWGRRISGSIKGNLAAAFSVAAVSAATRSVVMWADSLRDLSDDLGISTRTLQEWEYAADGTRANLDDFTRAFQFLAKQNRELSNFEVLQKFNALADSFRNGQVTLGELQKQLGRGAAVLVGPFSKGLSDTTKEAERLNRFLSDDQVESLAKLSDSWDKAKGLSKAYFAQAITGADELIKKFAQLNKSSVVGPGVVPGEFVRTGKAFESIDSQKAIARSAEWVGPTLPPDQQQEQQAKDDMRIRSSWSASSLTANQQVGAFVAAQPIVLTEIKEQTKVLRDIRKLAESIDDKS